MPQKRVLGELDFAFLIFSDVLFGPKSPKGPLGMIRPFFSEASFG